MKLHPLAWFVIIVTSIGFSVLSAIGNVQSHFHIFTHATGTTIGIIVTPLIIMGIVILIGRLFKAEPSKTTQRTVFFMFWVFMLFSQIQRFSTNSRVGYEKAVEMCIKATKEKDEFKNQLDAEVYCRCVVEKIYAKRIRMDSNTMKQMQDRNSVLFNELVLPCAEFAMFRNDSLSDILSINNKQSDTIKLISSIQGHKVKVTVGSETSYFLFDSGASDIIISKSMADRLKKEGLYVDSLYTLSYLIADGSEMECEVALINGFEIGSFMVNNVKVGIYDSDINFLLGTSFLDKFSSWSVTNSGDELILVK